MSEHWSQEKSRERETIVLNRDIPEHGLARGDVGAVVHRYASGEAYDVEFVTADGRTVAVLTLTGSEIRSMARGEILQVRELASA